MADGCSLRGALRAGGGLLPRVQDDSLAPPVNPHRTNFFSKRMNIAWLEWGGGCRGRNGEGHGKCRAHGLEVLTPKTPPAGDGK